MLKLIGASNLKKILILAFVLFLVSSTSVIVCAQSTHNLEWSVTEDQRIRYQINQRSELYVNDSVDGFERTFVLHLTIDEITEIPGDVSSTLDIPFLPISFKFQNDSIYNDVLIPVPLYTPLILPVGNWTLLNQMYSVVLNSVYSNLTISDSADLWSYQFLIDQYDSGSGLEIEYSKYDGIMTYMRSVIVLSDSAAIMWTIERFDTFDIVGIGVIAGLVGLLIIVLVFFWKRQTH